jgi:ferredoxin
MKGRTMMKYACLYYSATGNTKRAVELVRRELERAGSSVDMTRMRKDAAIPEMGKYDGVIVAFPVLAFSPPAFVNRFISNLPRAHKPAYVLAVDGGGGMSAGAMVVRLLERNGYDVRASARASYAENWTQVSEPPDARRAAEMARGGDAAAARFANAIVSGKKTGDVDRRISAVSAIAGFLFGTVGRRFFGKLYYADEDCDACGICAKQCPAETILLGTGEGARPFWKMSCEDCNACINVCPKKAINTSIARAIVLLAVIVASAWAGIWAYSAFVKPLFAGSISGALGTLMNVAAIVLIVLVAHVFPSALLDRYVLRYIQRVPGIRRFFAWTFTKKYRRYNARSIEGR